MVNFLMGAVLGFLSGLGVGGGSLLLLWITLVLEQPQETARMLNLMFFIPCALIATLFRWKHSFPAWHLAVPAVLAGLIGALLGNLLNPMLNLPLLKKAFGLLFIVCGIRELRYRPK